MYTNHSTPIAIIFFLATIILFSWTGFAIASNPLNITPLTTLKELRSKYSMEDISNIDTGFLSYLINGHNLEGRIIVNFINYRQLLNIMLNKECKFNVDEEGLIYASNVQFIPSSRVTKRAMVGRHGKRYIEKVDKNYTRFLEWPDLGIVSYLVGDGDTISQITYNFTGKVYEKDEKAKSALAVMCAFQQE